MAFTHVQSQSGHGSGVTGVTVTINPSQKNNLLVVSVYCTSTGQLNGVSGNGFLTSFNPSVPEVSLPDGSAANQYFSVDRGGGTTSVSAFCGSAQNMNVTVDEYSGGGVNNLTVFDNSVSATGTGSSTSVSLNPSQSNELIVSSLILAAGGTNPVPGSNYTAGAVDQINHTAYAQYRLAGTYAETPLTTWTGSSAWASITTSFAPNAPFATESFQRVQANYADSQTAAVSSLQASLAQTTSQGNLLIINLNFQGTVSGLTISDDVSPHNAYAVAAGPVAFSSGGGFSAYQYYGVQIKGGVSTVSISWVGTLNAVWCTVDEYSGGLQSNSLVLDTTATTTAANGQWGQLSSSQVLLSQGGNTTTNTIYAPLLHPGAASDLVTAAFFTSVAVPNIFVGGKTNIGYTLNTVGGAGSVNSAARVATAYRLTGNSSELPSAEWGNHADFAIIGAAYKAATSGGGIKLVQKTIWPVNESAKAYDSGALLYDPNGVGRAVFTNPIPATTRGNLLVISSCALDGFFTITSITDDVGNVYVAAHAAVAMPLSEEGVELWYGVQVTGGATVITVNYTGGTNRTVYINEYSGAAESNAAVFDKASGRNGAFTANKHPNETVFVTPFTPAQANELIVAVTSVEIDDTSEAAYNNYSFGVSNGYHMVNNAWPGYISANAYKIAGPASETAPFVFVPAGLSNTTNNEVALAALFFPSSTITIASFDIISSTEATVVVNTGTVSLPVADSTVTKDGPSQYSDLVTTSESLTVVVGILYNLHNTDSVVTSDPASLIIFSPTAPLQIAVSDLAAIFDTASAALFVVPAANQIIRTTNFIIIFK